MAAPDKPTIASMPVSPAKKISACEGGDECTGLHPILPQRKSWDSAFSIESRRGVACAESVTATPATARRDRECLFFLRTTVRVLEMARPAQPQPGGEAPCCGEAEPMGMLEVIQHGWGYDDVGRWYAEIEEVVRIPEETERVDDGRPALVRGTAWGLWLSIMFFWLPVGTAVFLLWRK